MAAMAECGPSSDPRSAHSSSTWRARCRLVGCGRWIPFSLQAFIGPIYFHLTTRQTLGEIVDLRIGLEDAVDQLVLATLEGLAP